MMAARLPSIISNARLTLRSYSLFESSFIPRLAQACWRRVWLQSSHGWPNNTLHRESLQQYHKSTEVSLIHEEHYHKGNPLPLQFMWEIIVKERSGMWCQYLAWATLHFKTCLASPRRSLAFIIQQVGSPSPATKQHSYMSSTVNWMRALVVIASLYMLGLRTRSFSHSSVYAFHTDLVIFHYIESSESDQIRILVSAAYISDCLDGQFLLLEIRVLSIWVF